MLPGFMAQPPARRQAGARRGREGNGTGRVGGALAKPAARVFEGVHHRLMILTCPACAMRYLVPDTAIPPSGRQVRCANCRHSWHQDARVAETGPGTRPVPSATPPVAVPASPPSRPLPPSMVSVEPRPMSNRPAPLPPAPATDVMAHRAPFTARRNPLRVASWIAGGLALLLLAIGVAAWAIGREPIARALGLPATADTPLVFVDRAVSNEQRSETTSMIILSGAILNVSAEEQSVPPIVAEGIDANGRVIYSWTFPPPKTTLAPGERVQYNNAHTGATDAVRAVDLSFNPPRR